MRTNLILVIVAAAGCSGSQPQTITGRVAPGFPDTMQSIEVVRGTAVVASSRVAADGSFRLAVPPSSGVQLRLIGSGHSNVVMPRTGGTIDQSFRILPGGRPFDLGAIFFVGNSSTTRFAFDTSSGSGSGSGSSGTCDSEDHDQTGATCVDDHSDGNECEAETDSEAETGDSVTGSGSGSASDDGTADGPDDGDAVPEHDFPAGGCSGGDD